MLQSAALGVDTVQISCSAYLFIDDEINIYIIYKTAARVVNTERKYL